MKWAQQPQPSELESTTRSKIVELVIQRGPITASQLAKVLNLTPAAIRRHILALEDASEIQAHEGAAPATVKRGRPARYYVATDSGRNKYQASYAQLAGEAMRYIVSIAGPEAIEEFTESRIQEFESKYADIVDRAGNSPSERARALAAALSEEGFAASVRTTGSTGLSLQLCQGNCPYQDVAEEFPQLCEAETKAISRLLGVHVQRLSTLAGGGHVCTTHVPINIRSNPNVG